MTLTLNSPSKPKFTENGPVHPKVKADLQALSMLVSRKRGSVCSRKKTRDNKIRIKF